MDAEAIAFDTIKVKQSTKKSNVMTQSSSLGYAWIESYPVCLYDMSIEDVEERYRQRQIFKKAVQAANFLGMVPNKLYEKIGTGLNKVYAYHRETKKKYAVRKLNN